jgi:nitrite reductase/ring-hydroxylating ferredoxin subunit
MVDRDAGVLEAVLVAEDAWVARRLDRLGAEFGLRWVAERDATGSPAVVVVDLAPPDAINRVRAVRGRWPRAVLAGYLAVPDHALWLSGQRAGCDLVANRGALVARLRPLLVAGGTRGRRTFPVLAEADVAGRLGLVMRLDESPVGPVAVYHVDGAVYVTSDRCPHAGAQLSDGALDQRVVTCPRHGSQFDVCTGERVRGPADMDIETYPVIVADGQVSMVVDGVV